MYKYYIQLIYNYNNQNNWKKCIGLLKFRKKIKTNNDYINLGLKGDTYEFAMKLNELLKLIIEFLPKELVMH